MQAKRRVGQRVNAGKIPSANTQCRTIEAYSAGEATCMPTITLPTANIYLPSDYLSDGFYLHMLTQFKALSYPALSGLVNLSDELLFQSVPRKRCPPAMERGGTGVAHKRVNFATLPTL